MLEWRKSRKSEGFAMQCASNDVNDLGEWVYRVGQEPDILIWQVFKRRSTVYRVGDVDYRSLSEAVLAIMY